MGREIKSFDIWGWIMCLLGLTLMAKYGGIGGPFGTQKDWWMVLVVFFVFWQYMWRVSFGRVYRFVYYDTILHRLYEIKIDDKDDVFYVCAENEEELTLYMELQYDGLKYEITKDTHVETYIKTDETF